MGFLKPPKIEAPGAAPAPPPAFAATKPTGQKKPTVPTFLGAEKMPKPGGEVGLGMERGKTLLGQ